MARGRLNPGFLSFSAEMKIGDGYLQGLLCWLTPGNDGEDSVSFILKSETPMVELGIGGE